MRLSGPSSRRFGAVFEWNPRELIQAHRCWQLDAALVKDRNRRILVVAARSSEGLFSN